MQIRNNTLITECSAYDFKEMLGRKKVKSWLKSVSAFANTEASSFFTTFYNLNWGKNERIPVEEVVEKFGVNAKMFGVNDKSSETRFGEGTDAPKNTGKTAQKIIDFVISDSSMSAETMAYKIGISSRAVEKQIAKLRSMGILSREGADFGGYWRIVINPQTEK